MHSCLSFCSSQKHKIYIYPLRTLSKSCNGRFICQQQHAARRERGEIMKLRGQRKSEHSITSACIGHRAHLMLPGRKMKYFVLNLIPEHCCSRGASSAAKLTHSSWSQYSLLPRKVNNTFFAPPPHCAAIIVVRPLHFVP